MLNFKRKTGFFIFWVATMSVSSWAFASVDLSDSQIETAVQEMLLNRHPKENSNEWLGLGSRAPQVLMRLYEMESTSFRRMRLIQGLGFFKDNADAVAFIKREAEKTQDDVIRNQALRVIGAHQGEKEEEFLSRYLKHENAQTRLAAARALKSLTSEKSKARYQQYLVEEKTPWIRNDLKGESTPPSVLHVQVSSPSEAPVPTAFFGNWSGHWVSLKPSSIVSFVQVILQPGPLARIEKKESTGKVSQTWRLGAFKGASTHWVASAVQIETGIETTAEGRWVSESGEPLLEIRLPQFGSWLLLKRELKK